MVDYRRFLGQQSNEVLAWLGGPYVFSAERRLKLGVPPATPGWYQFTVKGREATPGPACEPASLETLPRVRGHLWGARVVRDGGIAEPLALLPADELARFTPVTARRWHDGRLIFEQAEFESEVEGAARERLARDGTLAQLKSVPATLRAAFAYALAERVSQRLEIPFGSAELRVHLSLFAEGGVAAIEPVLRALEAERAQARRELEALESARAERARREEIIRARAARTADPVEAAAEALQAAGAVLEDARRVQGGRLDLVFQFMGERFATIVDGATLQVIDSGICLGHPPADRLITLDSLPGVIQEAIDTGRLVILRHP